MRALQQAMHAHQSGSLDAAEQLYRRVLQVSIAQPDALHYLGVLHHQRGQSDQAVELITQSLRITPRHADAHSNLGNIHKECGRYADAEACYRRALDIAPAHPQALGNLAIALEAQQRVDDARTAYRDWLARSPGDARGHYWFGRFLCSHPQAQEDIERAVECFKTAFALDNANLRALESLGMALYGLGRIDEAAAVYRDWGAHDPDDPIPRHMLSACGVAAAPSRAADEYIRKLFDGFSASFDEQLLTNLGYRAPQALLDALDALGESGESGETSETSERLDVLDAGCGTGLCAGLLRARARRLVGVDLSTGMLEQARRRGGYDELVCGELTAYLQAHPQTYDLVLCADTLIYFGELDTVLKATGAALRPGGRFAFSLEALPGEDTRYALEPSGRYQHSRSYVEHSLVSAGFEDVQINQQTLRKEAGKWVDGWVALARRPP